MPMSIVIKDPFSCCSLTYSSRLMHHHVIISWKPLELHFYCLSAFNALKISRIMSNMPALWCVPLNPVGISTLVPWASPGAKPCGWAAENTQKSTPIYAIYVIPTTFIRPLGLQWLQLCLCMSMRYQLVLYAWECIPVSNLFEVQSWWIYGFFLLSTHKLRLRPPSVHKGCDTYRI